MTTAIFTTATKVSGIRRSFEEERRVPSIASGSNRPICFGDKIFARLILRGKTIVEFMANRVNDLTELLGELRRKCRGASGLARLYLRNMSRGWSLERPMMLYDEARRSTPRIASVLSGDADDSYNPGVGLWSYCTGHPDYGL